MRYWTTQLPVSSRSRTSYRPAARRVASAGAVSSVSIPRAGERLGASRRRTATCSWGADGFVLNCGTTPTIPTSRGNPIAIRDRPKSRMPSAVSQPAGAGPPDDDDEFRELLRRSACLRRAYAHRTSPSISFGGTETAALARIRSSKFVRVPGRRALPAGDWRRAGGWRLRFVTGTLNRT